MPHYHLITGLPNAGKTTRLKQLFNADPGNKHEIPCTASFSEWLPKTAGWNEFLKARRRDDEKPTKAPTVRTQLLLLAQYITDQQIHLYVDNAHTVSGQKQELLKVLLLAAPVAVVTTIESNQLPVALRDLLIVDHTQIESLVNPNPHLQPAFDFTEVLVGLAFIASFFVEAHYSTSLLIGVVYLLNSRRFRAAKQR